MNVDNMAVLDVMNGNVSVNWAKWKRALNIYFDTKKIIEDKDKKNYLLHFGGIDLQDIYYTLAGEKEDKTYEEVIKILDNHFNPKSSSDIEKNKFRNLKQNKENINDFVLRLKMQAAKCEFKDNDERIREQILIGSRHTNLERKVIEKGAVNLNELIQMVQAMEIGKTEEADEVINKVDINRRQTYNGGNNFRNSRSQERSSVSFSSNNRNRGHSRPKRNAENRNGDNKETSSCFNCGRYGHYARDFRCPARNKKCAKCQKFGHFAMVCRKATNKRVKLIERDQPESSVSEKSDILTILKVQRDNEGMKAVCLMGGLKIRMTIDSGAAVNLISYATWKKAEKRNIIVLNEVHGYEKYLSSYNGSQIKVIKVIKTTMQYADVEVICEVYIVEGDGVSLLGCDTAVKLKIMQFNINSIKIEESIKSKETGSTGKLKGVEVQLQINSSVNPVIQQYRRVPLPLKEKVSKKLRELLAEDIIEKVKGSSKWISPLVIVPKDQGRDVRLCVDMRRANQAIEREIHPLPTFDCVLPDLSKSTIFSKLDIKNAFHQVVLAPSSREITTFITHEGLYRFKRLMFGLNCASEIFQKLMDNLLMGKKGVHVYIDDIIICGKDLQQHDKRLNDVLKLLKDNGLILNEKKCTFRKAEIVFMGHLITKDGIKPTESRVKDVQSFRAPVSKEEVRSFLGLVNFVGRFIPNLATITEPLKVLIRKDEIFRWAREQEEAFQNLKNLVANETRLGYFDVEDKCIIITDASPVALGAVLVQENNKKHRIIAFASKSLTETERKYSQTEKEALGIVWGVERFRMYVTGKRFDLITDHKSLETLFKPTSRPCARIERWVLRLQSFDMKVIFKPGKQNIADPLSRLVEKENKTHDEKGEIYIKEILQINKLKAISLEQIKQATEADEELILLKQVLQSGKWEGDVKKYARFEHELSEVDGLILRHNRIVIPHLLQDRILHLAHEGHPGESLMKRRLRVKVWWCSMDKDAENFVKCCEGCQIVSANVRPEPLYIFQLPERSWSQIRADFLGPLPSGENLLVIIDEYSKYVLVEIMREITSEKVIKNFKNIFTRFGIPEIIITDNGPQFKSRVMEEFCQTFNINIKHTIPYSPSSNGLVERQNRSILKRLKIAQIEKSDWKEELNDWLYLYNNSIHPSSGYSPAVVMFGRNFKEKIPNIREIPEVFDEDIRYNDREAKLKRKIYADTKRRAVESNVKIGDIVLKQNELMKNKLTPNFDDAKYQVIDRNDKMVKIRDDSGKVQTKRSDQVKKFNVGEKDEEVQSAEKQVSVNQNNMPVVEEKDAGTDTTRCVEPIEHQAGGSATMGSLSGGTSEIRRSARERKSPGYFKSYIMD